MKVWERVIERLDRIIQILERMANRKGALDRENEGKVLEYLKRHGKMTKQEMRALLKVSDQTCLRIMKDLSSLGNVLYIPGRGSRQSVLVYSNGDTAEAKALMITKLIPRGSSMKIEKIAEILGMDKSDVVAAVRTAQRLFPDELQMREGVVVRFR